jgi:hypothetical protein
MTDYKEINLLKKEIKIKEICKKELDKELTELYEKLKQAENNVKWNKGNLFNIVNKEQL